MRSRCIHSYQVRFLWKINFPLWIFLCKYTRTYSLVSCLIELYIRWCAMSSMATIKGPSKKPYRHAHKDSAYNIKYPLNFNSWCLYIYLWILFTFSFIFKAIKSSHFPMYTKRVVYTQWKSIYKILGIPCCPIYLSRKSTKFLFIYFFYF